MLLACFRNPLNNKLHSPVTCEAESRADEDGKIRAKPQCAKTNTNLESGGRTWPRRTVASRGSDAPSLSYYTPASFMRRLTAQGRSSRRKGRLAKRPWLSVVPASTAQGRSILRCNITGQILLVEASVSERQAVRQWLAKEKSRNLALPPTGTGRQCDEA